MAHNKGFLTFEQQKYARPTCKVYEWYRNFHTQKGQYRRFEFPTLPELKSDGNSKYGGREMAECGSRFEGKHRAAEV